MAHPGEGKDRAVVSPVTVEILAGDPHVPELVWVSCLCCDGAVDDELSVVSELAVGREEHPVLEVLQVWVGGVLILG